MVHIMIVIGRNHNVITRTRSVCEFLRCFDLPFDAGCWRGPPVPTQRDLLGYIVQLWESCTVIDERRLDQGAHGHICMGMGMPMHMHMHNVHVRKQSNYHIL